MVDFIMTPQEAVSRLQMGNKKYLASMQCIGDTSQNQREKTLLEGQRPYAIIVTCSDSRVIPEALFTASIGDLFVIRIAGNVMDDHQLGSIEYAVEHLVSGGKLRQRETALKKMRKNGEETAQTKRRHS